MNLQYRRINLEDDTELRAICEIDVTIPAMYDPDFIVDEKMIAHRMDDLKKRFGSEDFLEVVLTSDQKIVGFHIVKRTSWFGKPAGHIYTIWVSPDHRKQGIAKELKERAENWARAHGLDHFETMVNSNNPRMLALNQQMGYETVALKMKKKF